MSGPQDAIGRVDQHDPARLNAVADAVMDVLGFVTLSQRYAIAVLALEALENPVPPLDPPGIDDHEERAHG